MNASHKLFELGIIDGIPYESYIQKGKRPGSSYKKLLGPVVAGYFHLEVRTLVGFVTTSKKISSFVLTSGQPS